MADPLLEVRQCLFVFGSVCWGFAGVCWLGLSVFVMGLQDFVSVC